MIEELDAEGWLIGATRQVSENQDDRPDGEAIRLIVMHAISLPPGRFEGDAVSRLFTNRLDSTAHPYFAALAGRRVSAHFFLRRDGQTVQFVACRQRAWHAGASCWRGKARCNDYSIGIEMEGDDFTPYTENQYAALTRLLKQLVASYPIEAIVGHADVAPGRKTDPGPYFDWSRILAQGQAGQAGVA